MSDELDLSLLTPEEQDEIYKDLVLQRCTSKEDLGNWLRFYLNVDLADCTVSRFASSNPLDMVWEIYQFCANNTNEDPMSIMYVAGRASQKTLSAGALQVLLPLHFKRGVVHLGGTQDQARRAYTYFKKFTSRKYIQPYLVSDPTQAKTSFRVDGEEIDVEILSISPMAVQGAHAPVVSLDELSSLSPEKILAYADVSGIPTYTNDGKPWIRYGISSRKGAYTVIETEYENREKTGMQFRFWSVLENTKRCPDSISGTENMTYYGNVYENVKATEEEYNRLQDMHKSKFEKIEAYKGCFNCPLAVVCGGDLKKQTSTCRTLRPTRSVITEFKGSEVQWFLSQKMSLTPSAEGLVFPRFKRATFLKTPAQMYQIFTGEKPGRDLTEEELISFMIKKGIKRYAGLDHGYTDAMVLIVIYEDAAGNIYIMNVTAMSGLEPDQLKDLVFTMKQKYDFQVVFPDTAQPALNKMLRKVVRIMDDYDKKGQIENGITLIRQKISPSGGGTMLFGLAGNVDFMITEMEKYHYAFDAGGRITDTPEDEYNHAIDALRYAAINRWKAMGRALAAPPQPELTDETNQEYNQKVGQQQNNWLSEEIRKTLEVADGSGPQASKNKGAVWDI